MRWPKGATQGTVIVGGNGFGEGPNQFKKLMALSFDRHGDLYVVDPWNARLIAAPALSENAQIMPVTISAYANGLAASDII
ncbi:unnamed protein product [Rotaria sp. Silwood1]|nr:unnamed protein product [Rotaria sp. Silwood1]